MIIKRQRNDIERMQGGKGHVIIDTILTEKEMNDKTKLFSEVTIEPKCTLGYHEHHGETETYFVTEGKGIYYDNSEAYEVGSGDVLFCCDGDGHGMDNIGDSDLRFVALIQKN